ncbi:MAG: flagellar hook-basal body protein [Vampirovibrionales bacterium]|nr:flagellar hook-basal body protein [Vampirovibrionales bacterium]
MIRGLYTAASGMMNSLLANDTLSGNLANADTVGFKKNRVSFQAFPEVMIQKMSADGTAAVGNISTGSRVRESRIDFTAGSMYQTGNTFDMAIEGPGFFTIQSKDDGKTYYTRAGHFTIDGDGFLSTANGDFVLGSLGKINTKQESPPFNITSSGDLTSHPGGETRGQGKIIDRIKITRFENDAFLQKASDTMFAPTQFTKTLPDPLTGDPLDYSIHQGALEHSNTNVVSELVNSITGLRLYEALQKNIHMQNETVGKAVNDVGRYR